MDNSSNDFCNESKQSTTKDQNSSSEHSDLVSEIEKLYLKIKEDWL